MAFQTTTIATQTQTVDSAVFQITTFEQRITVFCDCCDATETGTKTQLENRGWLLCGTSEFCDEHSY